MEVARHWRLKAQRYRLEGSICPTCGRLSFPARPVCPECSAKPVQIPGTEIPAFPLSNRTVDTNLLKG